MRANAKSMRRSQTRSEGRLWKWLRGRKFASHKFHRQHCVGRYILDFYCAELKLAIEVDGEHHDAPWMAEYDSTRTVELRARGIEILRVPSVLLIRDAPSVVEMIEIAIRAASKGPSPGLRPPSPR